jgi:hypothetical protein
VLGDLLLESLTTCVNAPLKIRTKQEHSGCNLSFTHHKQQGEVYHEPKPYVDH